MPGLVDLSTETKPFDTADAKYASLLKNLQGNILTSHGRHFSVHTTFTFGTDVAAAKTAVKTLRAQKFILSAAEQAAQSPRRQEVFGTLLLSARGLKALGLAVPAGFGDSKGPPGPPIDVSFAKPMSAAATELGDKPDTWEAKYRQPIDGLLIVAYGNTDANNSQAVLDQCYAHARRARDILERGATVLAVETGHAHLIDGQPREHFGFVDGISQPLFRTSDLKKAGAIDQFDPGDGLVNLLVDDPFTTAADAFASFFVFRKLEQNVAGWRAAVEKTAGDLPSQPEPDIVGAMAVGRFQNGDPVLLPQRPGDPPPASTIVNNFTYEGDRNGLKCPFHAHIRKSNPRGDTDRSFGSGDGSLTPQERARRIARRGVSYGDRARDLSDAPTGGVGLLFMCYQANIPDQFAFIQKNWVDNVGFGRKSPPLVGQDAVIGQGDATDQVWPDPWGGPNTIALPDFGKFVTNKGGEFFLAVSIPTIEAL